MSRIQLAAQEKTPLTTRLATGELVQDWTGFEEARLFEAAVLDQSTYRHIPSATIRQESNALEQIEMMNHSDCGWNELVRVMDCIYEEYAWLQDQHYMKPSKSRGVPADQKKKVAILERFAKMLFILVKKMLQHTMAYRIARAIIVDNATEGELANVFSDLDPPRFCRVAQKRGCEDMTRAIKSSKDPKNKSRSIARIDLETLTRMAKHILKLFLGAPRN
ncbi:unnamed protein product [Cylindrotheca closterium]|uniref:Uncharacterized protein n=1 Tax=Cylindrotheca closterium TaxID=2856 RepID=A0AAD2JGN5_9STRA|nr:unnamed protein product [Cylindrotheca closterium]